MVGRFISVVSRLHKTGARTFVCIATLIKKLRKGTFYITVMYFEKRAFVCGMYA